MRLKPSLCLWVPNILTPSYYQLLKNPERAFKEGRFDFSYILSHIQIHCPGVLCDEPDPLLPVLRAAGARGRALPGEVLVCQGQPPAAPAGGLQQPLLHIQDIIHSTGSRIFKYLISSSKILKMCIKCRASSFQMSDAKY